MTTPGLNNPSYHCRQCDQLAVKVAFRFSQTQLFDCHSDGTIDATIATHGPSCSYLVEKQVQPKCQSSIVKVSGIQNNIKEILYGKMGIHCYLFL